jgi:hypothetical protein
VVSAVLIGIAWTTKSERKEETSDLRRPVVTAVAPAELAALAYVPNDVDLIAGLHLAELVDSSPLGAVLFHLRREESSLPQLEHSCGLELQDVDHIVVGIKHSPLCVSAVVRLRTGYNEPHMRQALRAGPGKQLGAAIVFPFVLPNLEAVNAWLCCADDRTLIYLFTRNSLNDISAAWVHGIEDKDVREHLQDRFSGPICTILNNRLPKGTQAWVVSHSPDRSTLPRYLQMIQAGAWATRPANESELGIGANIRTFCSWVRFERSVTYHAEAECTDGAAAVSVDHYVSRQTEGLANADSVPLFRGSSKSLAADLGSSLRRERKGNSVVLEATSKFYSFANSISVRNWNVMPALE